MLKNYQDEQSSLKLKLNELTTKNKTNLTNLERMNQFKKVLDKYLSFNELTKEMVNSLIDHIEISAPSIKEGEKTREVKIIYRFING